MAPILSGLLLLGVLCGHADRTHAERGVPIAPRGVPLAPRGVPLAPRGSLLSGLDEVPRRDEVPGRDEAPGGDKGSATAARASRFGGGALVSTRGFLVGFATGVGIAALVAAGFALGRAGGKHAERRRMAEVSPGRAHASPRGAHASPQGDGASGGGDRERTLHDMRQRINELSCLYGVANLTRKGRALAGMFQETAELIPCGWHYPEVARAKIRFEGGECVSEAFEETQWRQTSPIVVEGEAKGSVEVYYLEERPRLDEGPFAKEERQLIDEIARALSAAIEHKRAEEALRESELFNKTIISSVGEGIVVYDQELRCRLWDSFMEGLTGLAAEEALGRNAAELFPHLREQGVERLLERALAGETLRSAETPYRVPATGKEGWVTGVYSPHVSADGEIIGVVATLRDTTERRRAEEALRRAHDQLERRVEERTAELTRANAILEREIAERKRAEERARLHQAELAHVSRLSVIGEMASGLAHELNQPLCAINTTAQGCLRMMRSGKGVTPRLLEAIEDVVTQAERAGRVLRRVRGFARKRDPVRAEVDVNALIREVVGFAEGDLERHRVETRLELADPLPPVLADSIEIEQVLLNLLLNGIEAMTDVPPEERRLVLRTTLQASPSEPTEANGPASAGPVVEVAVRDYGHGLPQENVERIFEPFYTSKPDGLGVGLSSSRSIVEAHGSRLRAAPCADRGATFWFTLPIAQGHRASEGGARHGT